MRTILSRLIAPLMAAVLANAAQAETVVVAVASNFTAPMQKIAAQFEQDTGYKTQLSFGATGKFYAQIHNGAPFHVLLAADEATPSKIAREGLGLASTRFTYAIGKLVLWSKESGFVDQQAASLKQDNWQHIAVANPKLSPYGLAAMQTLSKLGLNEKIGNKIVQGENINQTYQFVATGNAQLGFIALSQVIQNGQIASGSGWIIPATMHDAIRQDAIALNNAKNNAAARALMHYLQSDTAQAIISNYGYALPSR